MLGDVFADARVQAAGVVGLLALSAYLLVCVVQRASLIRALEVDVQSHRARRDSLDAANAAARIALVRLSRADAVFRTLQRAGFVAPPTGSSRFLLYPAAVPAGDGALTPDLAARLKEERRVLRGNESWLWGWVRRLPALRNAEGSAP